MKIIRKLLPVMFCVITVLGAFASGFTVSSGAASADDLEYKIENGEATVTKCNEAVSGELVIPSTIDGCRVTKLDCLAFHLCKNITGVIIPETVRDAYGAFADCENIEYFSVDENNEYYSSDEYGVLFSKDKTELIQYPCGSSIKSYTVPEGTKVIREQAFEGCDKLKSVKLPESLKNINMGAFRFCSALKKINIPSGVTEIGDYSFSYCSSLEKITVDENNEAYSSDKYGVLFSKDYKILIKYPENSNTEKYTVPDTVLTVRENAFHLCENLKEVIFAGKNTDIGSYAFLNCTNLKAVTLPEELKEIKEFTFGHCESLEKINIPEQVSRIGKAAFDNCRSLGEITIPGTVTDIKSMAFNECTGLKKVTLSSGIENIGQKAFSGCVSLAQVNLPDSIRSIDSFAFYGCESLAGINIPAGLKYVDDVFYGCSGMEYFSVDENNENYSNDENGVLFNKQKTEIIQYPSANKTRVYFIPGSVTKVRADAFCECKNLTGIIVAKSVTTIEEGAFNGCAALEEINVDENNEYYVSENGVLFNKIEAILIRFPEGSKITDYVIPDSVMVIGEGAFENCTGLKSVFIPDIIAIRDYAFSGCTGLTDVYYIRDAESKNNINIGSGNSDLDNLNWHYSSKVPEKADNFIVSFLKRIFREAGRKYDELRSMKSKRIV